MRELPGVDWMAEFRFAGHDREWCDAIIDRLVAKVADRPDIDLEVDLYRVLALARVAVAALNFKEPSVIVTLDRFLDSEVTLHHRARLAMYDRRGREADDDRMLALLTACPRCGAPEGTPCRTAKGNQADLHSGRLPRRQR